MADPTNPDCSIAIIGMTGRFPGASTIAQFWSNLRNGVESIRLFSEQELIDAGIDEQLCRRPNYVHAGTTIDGPDLFDANFFGFNPREAELTDPQHRLFLECAHEALECAGYDPFSFNGLIGVYAGSTMSSYLINNLHRNPEVLDGVSELEVLVGNDKDFVPTRVSYKLNLRGPGLNVQTGCSTSLVAVHLACQALLEGTCDIALAGGVSLRFPQPSGYLFVEEGILSPDGHCRPFDRKGSGTVAGAGAGVVVLKRLSEALEHGDQILAVIKGSAINNDGAEKVGFTAPGVAGQAEVIMAAHAMAGVAPHTITYVETHGTGTHLGDPIEMAALTKAFGPAGRDRGYCAIGALKSNVGHMDAAAGVAGLIKTVLQLQHNEIAPTLHFRDPNPAIDFANSPFYVNAVVQDWNVPDGGPRRAGVSSFGIGGTNAHVVVEQAPPQADSGPAKTAQLLVFSAKTASALERSMQNVAAFVREHPDEKLADVAYTLQTGRTAHPYRAVVVCSSGTGAVGAIEAKSESAAAAPACRQKRGVAFLFPGGGAQYPGMGRGLYRTERVYREVIDRCSTLLESSLGCDIRSLLFPCDSALDEAAVQLRRTSLGLPALFATEFATAQLLRSWGIEPEAMIGHSSGEYVAACIAGVLPLEAAIEIVAARSRLMESLPGGAMLAVPLDECQTKQRLSGDLAIVAINAPELCVVGGTVNQIDQLAAALGRDNIDCHRLHISVASHCALVEPMMDDFGQVLRRIEFGKAQLPVVSNISGTWWTGSDGASPSYWLNHLRRTVRFADGVGTLLASPSRVLVEVGPGRTLSTLADAHPGKHEGQLAVPSQRHPRDAEPDDEFLMNMIGKLWAAGVEVDWNRFHHGEHRRRVLLPTYPFEKARYFVEPVERQTAAHRSSGRKTKVEDWFYSPVWKQSAHTGPVAAALAGRPRVLLIADKYGVAERIHERLSGQAELTMVRPDKGFVAASDGSFRIPPSDPSAFEALFERLSPNRLPDIIVHASSLHRQAIPVEDVLTTGFHSLVALAQAIGNRVAGRKICLKILSNNIHRLSNECVCYPERATLLGPCKVIPQEYRGIHCQSIDIDLSSEREFTDIVAEMVAEEILAEGPDSMVAYRGDRRWTQVFEPTPLPRPGSSPALLRQSGVYLITGGLKGIGLEIADYLGSSLQATLVLVARSQFPPREEWGTLQRAAPAGDPASITIARLLAIEEQGARVHTLRADVTDITQVAGVVRYAVDRFGAIDGVIHAAGLPGGGLIQLKSPSMAAEVIAPKLSGTLHLCDALAEAQPAFVAMCSSMSSVLGGLGHVDYCAANAFLDAFAQSRTSRHGTHFVAIDWNTWKGVGMAATVDFPSDMVEWKKDIHSQGITAHEGVDCFARILNSRIPQIAVCTRDLPALIKEGFSYSPPDHGADGARPALRPMHSRPNLSVEYAAPETDLQRETAGLWERLLGVQPIGINDNFFALGGHSLLGTRLMSRVREQFSVEMPLRTLFEQPTVAGLCQRITEAQQRFKQQDFELLEMLETLDEEQVEAELLRRLGKGA